MATTLDDWWVRVTRGNMSVSEAREMALYFYYRLIFLSEIYNCKEVDQLKSLVLELIVSTPALKPLAYHLDHQHLLRKNHGKKMFMEATH